MMARSLQNAFMALEPLLRKVVKEEMERGLVQRTCFIQRSSQPQIEEIEASNMQLVFKRPLSLPIFTGTKIEDVDGNPLQIMLVDSKNGRQNTPLTLPSPIKLEVVVIDGVFLPESSQNWSSIEFDKHIVKERDGKRPLIIGEINVTMKDTCSCIISELTITDNSSWIKSRHFRIGVKVAPGSYEGSRIREAMTERFMVKDHRGESYKKHYPPYLTDDVWRLEKIGKGGTFHKRLISEDIHTVQDFLKLQAVNPNRLRQILGFGMSDHMWEVTLNHARTCESGEKVYLYRGSQCSLLLSPICELVGIVVQNVTLTPQDLNTAQREIVQQMVREAYKHWDMMEEAGEDFGNIPSLRNVTMAQGSIGQPWYSEHQGNALLRFQIEDFAEIDEEAQNTLQQGYNWLRPKP